MEMRKFLVLAIGLVALHGSHADAANTEATARAVALETQAARIYAAAGEIEQARLNRRAPAADLPTRMHVARSAIDALATIARAETDAVTVRKIGQLMPLLPAIDDASTAPADQLRGALIPAHLAPERRAPFDLVDAHDGATCASAIGFAPEAERDGWLPAQAELWLRFEAPGPALYRVHTAATPLDTEITVFSRCPGSTAEAPLALNDDTFGLAAAVPVDLRDTPGPRWLRVRNLGSAGSVAIIADTSGIVSGRVTDLQTGAPISGGAQVLFYPQSGFPFYNGSVYADASGNFSATLAPGSYYAAATASGHVGMVWQTVPCQIYYYNSIQTCNLAQATPVVVSTGTSTNGINFALDTGAQISGRVRDLKTGAPVTDANVVLFDQSNAVVANSGVDAAGRYAFAALIAGTYHVQATSNTHMAQAYYHVNCAASCDPAAGSSITLATDAVLQNVDFDPVPLLYVNVAINAVGTSNFYGNGSINVYDAAGAPVLNQSLYGQVGQVFVVGPLAAGNYRVAVSYLGYFSQLYDHVNCTTDCTGQFAQASPVKVSNDLPIPALTFDLAPTPTVSGRITDTTSGLGLANVNVQLVSTTTGYGNSANTAADGTYSVSQLAPGSYYVVARSPDHRDTVYPNGACSENGQGVTGCALTQAQTVAITYGAGNVVNINIALPANAAITGSVRFRTAGTTQFPVASAGVQLYSAQGYQVATTYAGSDGTYQFIDVVPGTYYVEAIDYRYFSQIYAGVDCPLLGQSCNPTSGTPVTLTQGQVVAAIDFNPVASSMITGRVTDAVSGAAVSGAALDLWGTDNSHCGIAVTDANGYYVLGSYYTYCSGVSRKVSTDAGNAYINQVYSGIACPLGPAYLGLCPLSAATLIAVPATQAQLIVANFGLRSNDPIFANGFD